jgi:hypothetical protein
LVGLELFDKRFTETRLLLDSGAVFAEPTDEPTLASLVVNDCYVVTNSHSNTSGAMDSQRTLTLGQFRVKRIFMINRHWFDSSGYQAIPSVQISYTVGNKEYFFVPDFSKSIPMNWNEK